MTVVSLSVPVRHVCDAVDAYVARRGRRPVDRAMLFDGGHRPYYATVMARRLLLHVLHDMYGMTYRELRGLSHLSVCRLMHNVSYARYLCVSDADYVSVMGDICCRMRDDFYGW